MPEQTILVADDDPDFLKDAEEYLRDEGGYGVVTANDAAKTRHALRQENADLAVLDLRIVNGKDIKDITGLIMATTLAPRMPKVLVTAHPTPEILQAVNEFKASGHSVPLYLVGKAEGLGAVLAAVNGAFDAEIPVEDAWIPGEDAWWIQESSKIIVMLLLLALGMGILATVNVDVRWLIGTVVLVIFAVFFIGTSTRR